MTLGRPTLAGTGTVNGSVTTTAGSTMSPGGSIGTLTVTGNLTMAGGDNINYEVSGAGDDLISVGGTMTLGTVATNLNFGVWGTLPALGITRLPGRGRLWLAGMSIVNQTRYNVAAIVTPGAAGRIDVNVAAAGGRSLPVGLERNRYQRHCQHLGRDKLRRVAQRRCW